MKANQMIRTLLTFVLLAFAVQLTGQTVIRSFPDRANSPSRAKALKKKRLDVFNERTFKGFFYAEANYGLTGTFSRDEVFTVSAPVVLGVGYRFSSNISVGLRAGQSIYNSDMYYFDRTFETRAQTKIQVATAKMNAHLPIGLRGEAYGGFGLGYQNTSIEALEASEKPEMADRRVVRPQVGLFGTAQVGGRYSLTPTLSVQGEISSGLTTLSMGLRYRIR